MTKLKREFVGLVTSNKMAKTIVVEIVTPKPVALYRKYVKRTKKLVAHDESALAGVGDTVRVIETRPLSKTKRWRLVEVVQKARTLEESREEV